MLVDVTSLSSYQKQLAVTIPADKVKAEIDAAFKTMARKAKLPGFRPGHAPRAVLEAKYLGQVCSDVANDLMNSAWRKALADHSLVPITEPKVEIPAPLQPHADFLFTIQFEVRPEFQLTSYTGLTVVWPPAEVPEAEVDAAVAARLQQNARLVEVSGRPAETADLVMAEFVVDDDGTEVVREVGTLVRLAGDAWYPGLEAVLVGRSVGDAFAGEVRFGAGARAEGVAGRTLTVSGTVLSIQVSEAPAVTNDVAGELGFEGGIEGMRAALRARLASGREEAARNQARANVLERLIEANPFDVPTALSQHALRMLVDELRHQQAARTGQNPKSIGFSAATMEDLARRSVFAAKAELLVERVAAVEAIAPSETDIENRLQQIATERGQAIEAVRGWYARDRARDELLQRLKEEMTLDWLLERSVIVSSAPVAEAPPEPVADAKPKKKASKKSAAAEPSEQAAPEPEAGSARPATEPATDAAEKPKRARKKKE